MIKALMLKAYRTSPTWPHFVPSLLVQTQTLLMRVTDKTGAKSCYFPTAPWYPMRKRNDRHTGRMRKSILKRADIASTTFCFAQNPSQTCCPNYNQDDFESTCTSNSILKLSCCTCLMQEVGGTVLIPNSTGCF